MDANSHGGVGTGTGASIDESFPVTVTDSNHREAGMMHAVTRGVTLPGRSSLEKEAQEAQKDFSPSS